jgi:hypothetical protein
MTFTSQILALSLLLLALWAVGFLSVPSWLADVFNWFGPQPDGQHTKLPNTVTPIISDERSWRRASKSKNKPNRGTKKRVTPSAKQVYDAFLVVDFEGTCELGSDFDYPNEIIVRVPSAH